jgi:hypothetical protein
MARSKSLCTADMNRPVVALLRAAKKLSGERALELIPDRVHPSPGVHLVMAGAVLRAWRAPSIVSSVEINALNGDVLTAENTKVESVQLADGLSWTQLDEALPMPVEPQDGTIELALRYSDFTSRFNQQTLKVADLASGAYRLEIDEQPVGTFPAARLAQGINLAFLQTPMSEQAQSVLQLTYKHTWIHFARWALIETSLAEYNFSGTRATTEMLDSLEEEAISLQRAAAAPKPHRYRLIKNSPQTAPAAISHSE